MADNVAVLNSGPAGNVVDTVTGTVGDVVGGPGSAPDPARDDTAELPDITLPDIHTLPM